MQGFLNEISTLTEIPFDYLSGNFKITILSFDVVYISNFIKILSYSNEQVTLKVKNNTLNIYGENISISQLSPKELILKGEFKNIECERNAKKSR